MSGVTSPATNQVAASSVSAIVTLSASHPRSTRHGCPLQASIVSRVSCIPCENTLWLTALIGTSSA